MGRGLVQLMVCTVQTHHVCDAQGRPAKQEPSKDSADVIGKRGNDRERAERWSLFLDSFGQSRQLLRLQFCQGSRRG